MAPRPDRNLLAGGALVIALLLAIAAATWVNLRRVRFDALALARAQDVVAALDELLSTAKDAETGQRGFLITGEARYLAPYETASATVDAQVERVGRLVAGDPQQKARLPEVRRLVAAKRAELDASIATYRASGPDAARAMVRTDRGKELMDALRTAVGTMRAAEMRVVAERSERSTRSYRVALLSTFASAAIGLVLIGLLLRAGARGLRERAAAAAALFEQKELLQTTLGSIGDAVITTDVDGRVRFMNPVATQLTGWSVADAGGRPLGEVFAIVNETTRTPVDNPALRALREGRIVGLANHTVLIGRDGAEHPIDDSAAPIRDARGAVVGAVLVFRDVAEQRRAHDELLASESRKSAILETALDCILSIDEQGRILEFNPACEKTFGRLRDSVLGRDAIELLVPTRRRAGLRSGLARYLGDGPGSILGRRIEVSALRADGSEFPIELSMVAIPDGERSTYTAYLRDIAARREAERTIQRLLATERARTERLGRVAAASATINSALTESSVVGVVCREAKELLGADDARLLTDGVAPANGVSTLLAPLAGRGGRTLGVLCLTRRPTPFDAEDEAILVQLAHLAAVALENARLYEELRAGDRRKDEFLATLAHELRNPLAPIRNALRILRLSSGDPSIAEQSRALIERQVEQVVRLVDDLLDVSRISQGKLTLRRERVQLAAVVEAALETSRPLIEAGGHALEVALPDEPVWLDGDPTRLAQVFLNLLNNAAKYTRDGGSIWLTAERTGATVVVRVRDTGIGIPPAMLPRVFDMFTQVEERSLQREQGGLGIGLTLVKQLVEMHDGTVAAHSDGLGAGSEFAVRLPVAPPGEPPAAAGSTGDGRRVRDRKLRILVVDDNRDAVESLGILLEMMDYEVRTAEDGLEALDVAAAFAPDVVLLDIGLPRLNGYEVAERLRKSDGGAAVFLVALTGWGQEDDRRRSREAGFDRHLVKPVDPDALEELLRQHAGRTQGDG